MPADSHIPAVRWAAKKQEHDERAVHGWRNTFEEKATTRNSNKRQGFFSYEDRRRIRMAESGWKNVIIKLPAKPPAFPMSDKEEAEELAMQYFLREKGNYCLICMGLVSNSPQERADCEQCRSVIHRGCIEHLSDQQSTLSSGTFEYNSTVTPSLETFDSLTLSSSSTTTAKTRCESHIGLSELGDSTSEIGGSERSDGTPERKDTIVWTCPDCIEDVGFKKNYRGLRHRLQYRDHMELFAVVKVNKFHGRYQDVNFRMLTVF